MTVRLFSSSIAHTSCALLQRCWRRLFHLMISIRLGCTSNKLTKFRFVTYRMFNFSSLHEHYQTSTLSIDESELSLMLRNPKFTNLMVEDIEQGNGMEKLIESAKLVLQYEQQDGCRHPSIISLLFDWLWAQKEVCLKPFRVVMAAMLMGYIGDYPSTSTTS